MRFLTCALLVLFVTIDAKETDVEKEKRGTGLKTSQPNDEQSSLAYSSAKVTQQTHLPSKGHAIQYVQQQPQVMYVPQTVYKYAQLPAQAQVAYAPTNQQYEQPVQYIQQTVSKSSQQQPTLTKIAYAPAPSSAAIPYSSAADVSSFSYSSPFVSYNNLGLLSQAVGKIATQNVQPVKLSSTVQYSSLKAVPQPQQQQQQQHVQYVQAPVQAPAPVAQQFYYQPVKSAAASPSNAQQQYVIAAPQQQYNFLPSKNYVPQYTILPQSLTYNIPQHQQLQAVQQVQAQPQYQYVQSSEQGQEQKVKEVHEPKENQQAAAYTVAPSQVTSQAYAQQPIAYAGAQKSGVTYA